MKKSILFFLFSVFIIHSAFSQITIAPTNLFIGSQSKFGTYMVINGSNENQEVSIDFFFGYSQSDEAGNRKISDNDSLKARTHSIAQWVKAFPKDFILAPGQRQTVRIRVNAPKNLEEGTYWARIRTSSSPQAQAVELQANDAVSARVGIKIEQVTGLYYKNGNVSTGIEIENISPLVKEPSDLQILTTVKRTGNSPFLGTITANLYDNNHNVVKNTFVSTTVFFDDIIKQDFDISDLPKGDYTIEVKFESKRNDISSSEIVQMPSVSKTISYTHK